MADPAARPTLLSERTLMSVSLVGGMLAGAVAAAFWISGIENRMGTLEAKQDQMLSMMREFTADSISRAELRIWLELCRAKGIELPEFPGR